jgi:dihydropteroate synthase
MGIVNVTPDSFSDGGLYHSTEAALAHAQQLVADGADIIDVGGESTRPGHTEITSAIEIERILAVVESLAASGVCVSVDTRHEATIRQVFAAGATFVNRIYDLIDADGEVVAVDPGFGFVDSYEQDLARWVELDRLVAGPHPVMIGVSRKRLIGRISGIREARKRDEASAQIALAAILHGVAIVRVHDVAATKRLLDEYRDAPHVTAYLALGSNLGDREENLTHAIARIDALPDTAVVAVSSFLDNPAQYVTEQPDFLNAVLRIETKLPLFALFLELQALEVALGRVKEIEKGPRIIDIDVLEYDDIRYLTKELTIPHPLMHERDFVQIPLAQVRI